MVKGRQPHFLPRSTRILISIAALMAVMMVTLDSTIAVIALPRIQSTTAASSEQIAWVVTSYLIAVVISTPLAGWLADRFGRLRIIQLSILGFTLSSLGCGLAPNLELLVIFRFAQGFCGAGLIPLTQTMILDTYPPEEHGTAMGMFGIGSLIGPVLGPTLGAWLLEIASWRWIFLINLPVGMLALLAFVLFARDNTKMVAAPFDLRGFFAISLALGSLQLMLDRGQMLDWFSSTEIVVEAFVAVVAGYCAIVHFLTVRDPFIKPEIFKDRNFLLGNLLSALVGVLFVGAIPLMTNLMQQQLGYPPILTGLLSLPRAIGNILGILLVSRLAGKIDPRPLLFIGMCFLTLSMWIPSNMSLDTGQFMIGLHSFMQGAAAGFVFLPLTLAVFATLPHRYRNEASALFSQFRTLGGAIGVSVLTTITLRDMAQTKSRLVEGVRPDNPMAEWHFPGLDGAVPDSLHMAMHEVMRQSAIVASVDTFRWLFLICLCAMPLCLLMRITPGVQNQPRPVHSGMD